LFAPFLYAVSGMSQGLKKPVYMTGLIVFYLLALRIPTAFWVASRWGELELFWSHPAASAGTALLAANLLWRLVSKAKEGCA
jgi:Na+-driven multidrug efflux pump